MKVKFFGVRGSYAVPGADTVKYGGNTTCVSVTNDNEGQLERVVVDCGTGAVKLGKEIVGNFFAKKESMEFQMVFTHLHPDHTQGFPFFAPNFFANAVIDMYGMEALKKNVGKVLESTMLPPQFPIEYSDLKSSRDHHILKDADAILMKTMDIDVMQSYAPSHPQQGCLYYKFTSKKTGNKVACVWDLESKNGGDQRIIAFAKGVNVMIHDAQYTEEEYNSDKMIVQGFGHSTYDMAIENALKAGVKDALIFTHYNPPHTDTILDDIQVKIKAKYPNLPFQLIWAKEGDEYDI